MREDEYFRIGGRSRCWSGKERLHSQECTWKSNEKWIYSLDLVVASDASCALGLRAGSTSEEARVFAAY